MKGEPDISKDREPKGLSQVSSSMKQTKMAQDPSERNNCSGKQARVSARRQTDSQEHLTQAALLEGAFCRMPVSKQGAAEKSFRHNHTAISMGCSPHEVVPPWLDRIISYFGLCWFQEQNNPLRMWREREMIRYFKMWVRDCYIWNIKFGHEALLNSTGFKGQLTFLV